MTSEAQDNIPVPGQGPNYVIDAARCRPFAKSRTAFATGHCAYTPATERRPPEEPPEETTENLAVKSAANTLCRLVSQTFYGKLPTLQCWNPPVKTACA